MVDLRQAADGPFIVHTERNLVANGAEIEMQRVHD
jgi:hypothetical protein